jgi:hypothetical protein
LTKSWTFELNLSDRLLVVLAGGEEPGAMGAGLGQLAVLPEGDEHQPARVIDFLVRTDVEAVAVRRPQDDVDLLPGIFREDGRHHLRVVPVVRPFHAERRVRVVELGADAEGLRHRHLLPGVLRIRHHHLDLGVRVVPVPPGLARLGALEDLVVVPDRVVPLEDLVPGVEIVPDVDPLLLARGDRGRGGVRFLVLGRSDRRGLRLLVLGCGDRRGLRLLVLGIPVDTQSEQNEQRRCADRPY